MARTTVSSEFSTNGATLSRLAQQALGIGVTGVTAALGVAIRDTLGLGIDRREIVLPALPAELHGIRILHVSDLHAGFGPGLALLRRTVAVASTEAPELIAVTGDLVTRRRAAGRAVDLLDRLADCATCGAFAVLGNHDLGVANDPFAQGFEPAFERLALLDGRATAVTVRGMPIAIGGVAARAYLAGASGAELVPDRPEGTALSVLLCHFPALLERLPPGACDLMLAGHLHGGQICVPWPGGRKSLAHPSAGTGRAIGVREGTTCHVSAGIGTTFVPVRALAPATISLLTLVAR